MFTSRLYAKRAIACLFIGLTLLLLSSYRVGAANTTVYVDPQESYVSSGGTFSINVTIADVPNLFGFDFNITWDSSVITYKAEVHDVYLNAIWGSGGQGVSWEQINVTGGVGCFRYVALSLGTEFTTTGTQTLLKLSFDVVAPSTTTLHFHIHSLSNKQYQPIPHTTVDGTVYVTGTTPDVAVTSVKPLKTNIGKGYTGNTNVTVENHGGFPATFNVTAYANTTAFASATVSLTIGRLIVTLTWNSSTFAYGNYTIKAVADTVQGETDTADNTYISAIQVHIGVPGDVSGPTQGVYDKIVNMRDISYMILLFNTRPESPNWNPNVDVNNDGVVNMRDISIAIINFNKHE